MVQRTRSIFWYSFAVAFWLLLPFPLVSTWARPTTPTIVYHFRAQWPGQFDLYTMPPDGGNPRQLTVTPGNDGRPVWSPDGTRIAFTSNRLIPSYRLAVIDCDGKNFQWLPDGAFVAPSYPDWSPDGTRLVFSAEAPEPGLKRDIFLLELASRKIRNLTQQPGEDNWPSWSPDGQWIAFASDRDPNFWPGGVTRYKDIYITDARGGQVQNLTQTKAEHELFPSWSPDGKQIAYTVGVTSEEIYLIDVKSRQKKQLTDFEFQERYGVMSLSWSPDSQQLFLTLSFKDHSDIYVMNRDGTNLRALTHSVAGADAQSPRLFDPKVLAVSPVGKQAITWGAIKQKHKSADFQQR